MRMCALLWFVLLTHYLCCFDFVNFVLGLGFRLDEFCSRVFFSVVACLRFFRVHRYFRELRVNAAAVVDVDTPKAIPLFCC